MRLMRPDMLEATSKKQKPEEFFRFNSNCWSSVLGKRSSRLPQKMGGRSETLEPAGSAPDSASGRSSKSARAGGLGAAGFIAAFRARPADDRDSAAEIPPSVHRLRPFDPDGATG